MKKYGHTFTFIFLIVIYFVIFTTNNNYLFLINFVIAEVILNIWSVISLFLFVQIKQKYFLKNSSKIEKFNFLIWVFAIIFIFPHIVLIRPKFIFIQLTYFLYLIIVCWLILDTSVSSWAQLLILKQKNSFFESLFLKKDSQQKTIRNYFHFCKILNFINNIIICVNQYFINHFLTSYSKMKIIYKINQKMVNPPKIYC